MNKEELGRFVDAASTAFETIAELIAKNPGVIGVWLRTLEPITFMEAMGVLDRWIRSELPNPPTFYRRDLFALDVRQIVLQDRFMASHQLRQADEQAKRDRSRMPSAAFRSIAEPYARIQALLARYDSGQITLVQFENLVEFIVETAFDVEYSDSYASKLRQRKLAGDTSADAIQGDLEGLAL
jgi:hypothetical protein